MTNLDILLMANRNLWRRKVRTILTIMGVVIGTAAIVIMLSLGFGLTESQRQSMAQWGSLNIIRVYPGQAWDREGNPIGEAKVLNDETLEELRRLPGVTAITPTFEVHGEVTWGRKRGFFPLVGLDPTQMDELEFSINHGRLLTGEDRLQIVVGAEVINNFWDDRPQPRRQGRNMYEPPPREDPSQLVGERISLTVYNGNQEKRIFNFTVVGVLDEKNMDRAWQAFGPIDDIKRIHEFMQRGSNNQQVEFYGGAMGRAMPIREQTSSQSGSGQNRPPELTYNYFLMRTDDVGQTKELSQALRDMGYNAHSMADSLEGIESTARILQAILGGIGSITLLVAALGITNTMIMSIYERTREIGIIKVIGASNHHIRAMFLTEALLIGFIGGVVGLALSYGGSYIINQVGQNFIGGGPGGPMGGGMVTNISIIPSWLAMFSIAFATLIGLLAGFFPSNRAIKLSPIEAIRQL